MIISHCGMGSQVDSSTQQLHVAFQKKQRRSQSFFYFCFLQKALYKLDFLNQPSQSIVKYSTRQKKVNFKMATELKMNKLHDDGKKCYNCYQCGYSCNAPYNLKIHMRVHSGEKPFVCSQCNYSCNQAGDLRIHLRTHSGEKPFKCKQCNYVLFQTS